MSRLPGTTREDKRSRLTLSPAVPPDWMHSIQSPGGQITQTPRECHVSASDRSGDASPAGDFTVPGLRGQREPTEAGVQAGSRALTAWAAQQENLPLSPLPLLRRRRDPLPLRRGHCHPRRSLSPLLGSGLAIFRRLPPSDPEIPLTHTYPEEIPRICRDLWRRTFKVIYNNKSVETTQRSTKEKLVK